MRFTFSASSPGKSGHRRRRTTQLGQSPSFPFWPQTFSDPDSAALLSFDPSSPQYSDSDASLALPETVVPETQFSGSDSISEFEATENPTGLVVLDTEDPLRIARSLQTDLGFPGGTSVADSEDEAVADKGGRKRAKEVEGGPAEQGFVDGYRQIFRRRRRVQKKKKELMFILCSWDCVERIVAQRPR